MQNEFSFIKRNNGQKVEIFKEITMVSNSEGENKNNSLKNQEKSKQWKLRKTADSIFSDIFRAEL